MRPSLRALLLWGWRSVLGERRQYVVMTLTLAVVAAVMVLAGIAMWHSSRPVEGATGSARAELYVEPTADRPIADVVRAAERRFSRLAVSYEGSLKTPGVSGDLRPSDRDLRGVLGGDRFEVLAGRYPHGQGEIAITPAIQRLVGEVNPRLGVGATLSTRTGGYQIVGLVRDPANYDSLAAYVAPGTIKRPASASLLIDAPEVEIFDFVNRYEIQSFGSVGSLAFSPFAVYALAGATSALLLTVLISSLGYVISAQRRLREFGLLSAVGATRRQVRLAVLASAVCVGVSGAALGVLVGFVVSAGAADVLAVVVRHDVEPDPRQWLVLPIVFGVVVVASVVGALQPARALGRIPAADALSARRPRGRPSRALPAVGVALLISAPALLAWAVGVERVAVAWTAPVVLLVGLCLLAPALARAGAAIAAGGPFVVRFAARDLVRQRQRTAMSLAALTAILAVPMTLFTVIGSADAAREEQPPNLPSNVLILREAASADAGQALHRREQPQPGARAALSQIKALIPDARISPVLVPVDPARPLNTSELGPGISAYESLFLSYKGPRDKVRSERPVWIATPKLLAAWAQPPLAPGDPDALSVSGETVKVAATPKAGAWALDTGSLHVPEATDIAPVWLNPATVRRRGLTAKPCCWMVVSGKPIPDELRTALVDAAGRNYVVMLPVEEAAPVPLGAYVLAVGLPVSLILVLLVLAAGRAEAALDLRLLGAVGASPTAMRGIAAGQAVILSLVAAASATCAAYFTWITWATTSLQIQPFVVPVELVAMLLGLPALAAAIAASTVRCDEVRGRYQWRHC